MASIQTGMAMMMALAVGGDDVGGGGGFGVANDPFRATKPYASFVRQGDLGDGGSSPARIALAAAPQAAPAASGIRGGGGGAPNGGAPGLGGNNVPAPVAGLGLPFVIAGLMLYRRARARRQS